jgi:MoaA/NifB/PqqE/SkfB family radical SAM enzyme
VERRIALFLPDPVPTRSITGKTCVTDARQVARKEANDYCMLPWFQGIVNWRGDYRICSVHTVGNLREQSFDEIYNSPRMQEIRQRMLRRTPDSCSWNCRQEAYDVPEQQSDEAPAVADA